MKKIGPLYVAHEANLSLFGFGNWYVKAQNHRSVRYRSAIREIEVDEHVWSVVLGRGRSLAVCFISKSIPEEEGLHRSQRVSRLTGDVFHSLVYVWRRVSIAYRWTNKQSNNSIPLLGL
jgi:hypothetical protein